MNVRRLAALAVVGVLAFALPLRAGAAVKREGVWPAVEKKVDLSFDGPPSEALKELAHEAGWSLVVQDGAGIDRAGKDVHVDVEDQPADSVLDALFIGRDVVAQRNGPLLTIAAPGQATAASTPAAFPTARGQDREIVGTDLVIQADEIVHDVTVTGGSAIVKGTVTGDLVVTYGSVVLRNGAHVVGDATVLGGRLHVEKGAHVDGDCHVTGGTIERDEGAVIGGDAVSTTHGPHHASRSSVHDNDNDDDADAIGDEERAPSRISVAARRIGRSLTRASLLFVLGCVLLALLAPQMERLRVEVAARPMRSFALGLVAAIAGSIALIVAMVLLCVTVIGIPVAVGLALALAVAVYGAVASVLTTFGAAVAGHRTDNARICISSSAAARFLVVTCIPWIGGLAAFVVMLIAIGALVATRGGGLLDRKRRAMLTAPV